MPQDNITGTPISQLNPFTQLPTNGVFPIVIDGATYKLDIALVLLLIRASASGNYISFLAPGVNDWSADDQGANSNYVVFLPNATGYAVQVVNLGGAGYENKIAIVVNKNTSTQNSWVANYHMYDEDGSVITSNELLNGFVYTFKRDDANWTLISKVADNGASAGGTQDLQAVTDKGAITTNPIQVGGITSNGQTSQIAGPSNASLSILRPDETNSQAYNVPSNGSSFQFRVYSFILVDDEKVFSADYAETPEIKDTENTGGVLALQIGWDPSNDTVNGYRLLLQQKDSDGNVSSSFNIGFDTSNNPVVYDQQTVYLDVAAGNNNPDFYYNSTDVFNSNVNFNGAAVLNKLLKMNIGSTQIRFDKSGITLNGLALKLWGYNEMWIANVKYVWPFAQGAADSILKNDGNGNLSWGNPLPYKYLVVVLGQTVGVERFSPDLIDLTSTAGSYYVDEDHTILGAYITVNVDLTNALISHNPFVADDNGNPAFLRVVKEPYDSGSQTSTVRAYAVNPSFVPVSSPFTERIEIKLY